LADEVDRIEPLDFAAALVEKAGGWESLNPSEVEESEDTSGGEDVQPRGPDGKFVAREEEAEELEESDEDFEEQEASEGEEQAEDDQDEDPEEVSEDEEYVLDLDPDVEAYLQKYDGDIGKALHAAAEGSSLIGRQGQEVGELRSQLNDLTQFLLKERQNAPVHQGPSIEAIIDEEGPERAAKEAYRRNDPQGLRRAIDAWKEEGEEGAYGAAVFVGGLQAELAKAEVLEIMQAREAYGQQQTSVGAEIAEVVKRHPDVEKYLPAMAQVAQDLPLLQAALANGDAKTKAQAFETLYRLAASQQVADTSSKAMRKVAISTRREAQEAKAQAAVLSASRRKSAGEEPSRVDSFKQAFRQATGLPDPEDE